MAARRRSKSTSKKTGTTSSNGRLYPEGVPLDANGSPLKGADIPADVAATIPMDEESARITQQHQEIMRKKAAGETTRWHGDTRVRYMEVITVHPHATVGIQQTYPVKDESIQDQPANSLRTYEQLKNYLRNNHWRGQHAKYKWTIYDDMNPNWAVGEIEFGPDAEWAKKYEEKMNGKQPPNGQPPYWQQQYPQQPYYPPYGPHPYYQPPPAQGYPTGAYPPAPPPQPAQPAPPPQQPAPQPPPQPAPQPPPPPPQPPPLPQPVMQQPGGQSDPFTQTLLDQNKYLFQLAMHAMQQPQLQSQQSQQYPYYPMYQPQQQQPQPAAVAPPPPPPDPLTQARDSMARLTEAVALAREWSTKLDPTAAAAAATTAAASSTPVEDDFPWKVKDIGPLRIILNQDGTPVDGVTSALMNGDKIAEGLNIVFEKIASVLEKRQNLTSAERQAAAKALADEANVAERKLNLMERVQAMKEREAEQTRLNQLAPFQPTAMPVPPATPQTAPAQAPQFVPPPPTEAPVAPAEAAPTPPEPVAQPSPSPPPVPEASPGPPQSAFRGRAVRANAPQG